MRASITAPHSMAMGKDLGPESMYLLSVSEKLVRIQLSFVDERIGFDVVNNLVFMMVKQNVALCVTLNCLQIPCLLMWVEMYRQMYRIDFFCIMMKFPPLLQSFVYLVFVMIISVVHFISMH